MSQTDVVIDLVAGTALIIVLILLYGGVAPSKKPDPQKQNRSQKTIANYDHYLTRLIDFAGDIKVRDIDSELVRKWRLWLNRLGTNTSDELSKTTQNYHLIALRSFLKYCAKRDIPALTADKVELARTKRKQVTFLGEEEIERLFA